MRGHFVRLSDVSPRSAKVPYRTWQDRERGLSFVEWELEEPWTVTLAFTDHDGELALAVLQVFPTKDEPSERGSGPVERDTRKGGRDWGEWRYEPGLVPRAGLAVRTLRQINVSGAIQAALRAVPRPESRLAAAGFVAADRPAGRQAKLRQDPVLLARVAVLYERARAEHQSPNSFIYAELQKTNDHVAQRTVAGLIRQARARGFLPQTSQGRPSDRATKAAHDLLSTKPAPEPPRGDRTSRSLAHTPPRVNDRPAPGSNRAGRK